MERTVSRAELGSPDSISEGESQTEVVERIRASSARFDYVTRPFEDQQDNTLDDDRLDFRLFATTTPTRSGEESANRIRLRSPTPQTGEPGFVNPERPPSYYSSKASDKANIARSEQAALSGEHIQALSRSPWPGSEYSWKVVHLPRSNETRLARSMMAANGAVREKPLFTGDDGLAKRKRHGKKTRIRVRMRLTAAAENIAKSKLDAEARACAEREKRAKRNKDKKLKKRARDKAKKAVTREDAVADGASSDDESDSG